MHRLGKYKFFMTAQNIQLSFIYIISKEQRKK